MPDLVDATGLQVATLEEIRALTAADIRGAPEFGPDADLGGDSGLAQLIDPVLFRLDETRQLLLAIHGATDADNAQGVQADSVAGLSGVIRETATPSAGTSTLAGTPTTVIPAGSIVKLPNVDGSDATLDAEATIGGGGTVDAEFTASANGPIVYPDGVALTIVTPVAGWTSATVNEPVQGAWSLGRNIETDTELLVRRNRSLQLGGNATAQAVAAAIEQLPDVDFAVAINNTALLPDVYGVPGKAMRLIVWPTTAEAERIALVQHAIWPGGIESEGAIEVQVTTIKQQSISYYHSYPDEIDIWVIVNLTAGLGYGGDQAVEDAVLAYASALIRPGTDVDPVDIICQIKADVAGVINPQVLVGLSNPPTLSAVIPIALTEIAIFDAARIAVNS